MKASHPLLPGPKYGCYVHADLQRLLADDCLKGMTDMPLDRLRGLRVEASAAEGDVSFVRRVAQGRLDIVGHEAKRRAGGEAPNAAQVDDLLFDMPDILTDPAVDGAGRTPRAVPVLEPGKIALGLVDDLNKIASPSDLSGVANLDKGQLADLFDSLREFEVDMSAIRRQLHDRIDSMQDEIARRYREGEASVDALLS